MSEHPPTSGQPSLGTVPPEAPTPDALSPTKRALLALREARSEIDRLRASRHEPIAVVGLGCRFPGGENPEAFWQLLRSGGDAVVDVPADRWDVDAIFDADPAAPGKSYARQGAFLSQGGELDADFFGISPREMATLDPQQRLLLEVAWEALEDAGLPVRDRDVPGRRTGVFAGIASGDFASLLQARGPESIDAYLATGTAHSVAAGRLSFLLGLDGPSLAVDTACSSSLVAVHLACQSLRQGECDVALAAGVNRILTADLTIAFCKNQMLSPSGRCHTFGAAADGFVRGEGCGVVTLRRLVDATRDGDRILALIAGSAVGQDGRTSGLTVPNGPSQQAVIDDALRAAGWSGADVAYVEAHGTGTPLGDPIEVAALASAYGSARRQPLLVGSVKTNVGHLEAAAGIAGLIKTVLAIHHRVLPPHRMGGPRNPRTPWSSIPIEVATEARPWPQPVASETSTAASPSAASVRARPVRAAGVSSFGFSGTNCHVLLAAAEASDAAAAGERARPASTRSARGWHLLPLSARSEPALAALRAEVCTALGDGDSIDLPSLCRDAARRRTHFEHRLAVLARDGAELTAGLSSGLAAGLADDNTQGVTSGRGASAANVWQQRAGEAPAIAFVFTGQGNPVAGAGRALFASEPAFRRAIERCDDALAAPGPGAFEPFASGALVQAIDGSESVERSLEPAALFAVEIALAALWARWGIEPDVVAGHSLGLYAAASVAGVMTPEDGVRLVAARARLMDERARPGFMASVSADRDLIDAVLEGYRDAVAVAAWNGPRQIVLSGLAAGMEAVLARLAEQGVRCQRLVAPHAFHSPAIDPMLAAFEELVGSVDLQPPRIELVVSQSDPEIGARPERRPLAVTDPRFWSRHAREPVDFARDVEVVDRLLDGLAPDEGNDPRAQGKGRRRGGASRAWIEIGPRPVLLALLHRMVSAPDPNATLLLPSLRPGRDDDEQMLGSLAQLYTRGAAIHWPAVVGDGPRGGFVLPRYPWQRTPFPLHPEGVAKPVGRLVPRSAPAGDADPTDDGSDTSTWLGERLPQVASRPGEHVWQRVVGGWDAPGGGDAGMDGRNDFSFLAGHRLGTTPLISFGTFVALARSAAQTVFGASGRGPTDRSGTDRSGTEPVVHEIEVHAPLLLGAEPLALQSVLTEDGSDTALAPSATFEVYARQQDRPSNAWNEGRYPWRLHASLRITLAPRAVSGPTAAANQAEPLRDVGEPGRGV